MIGSYKLVIKLQTVPGGVLCIGFVTWLISILGILQIYHDSDRLNFNCNPKPSDFIRQLCYNNYISAITKPHGLIPRDVVGITLLIVCGTYIMFAIYGDVTLRKKPGYMNENTNTFLWIYFIQVGFRILFLVSMSKLVYSYEKIVLPEFFECDVNQTNSQTTPSPLNQTKITLTCHDLHHNEKSKINIAYIAVNVLCMVLSIFEVLHLWCKRETCLQHLIGDLEDFKADDSPQSLPEKPTITNTEIEVDKDFIVTWSEAEANNSNCSIEYRLEWRKQPVTGSTEMAKRNIVGTRFKITGLEYDAEYEVKLFAVNKQGDSEPDVRTFKTKSGTVITPRENRSSAKKSNASPPELNIALKSMSNLPETSLNWSNVELPVDILLLTVEECEFLSCFAYLKEPFRSYDTSTGFVYFDQRKDLNIALMRCDKGPTQPWGTLAASREAISTLNPKVIFSVGACTGLKKVKLGDVVVSAKLITASFKTPPSGDIGKLIPHVAAGWKAPVKNANECNAELHSDGVVLSVSGANRNIIGQHPEAIAVEMEGGGGGVFAAAHIAKIEWVVVKGIKDFADETQSSSKKWKEVACVMAASVVAKILNDPVIFKDWRRSNRSTAS